MNLRCLHLNCCNIIDYSICVQRLIRILFKGFFGILVAKVTVLIQQKM